jgi:hypothetical protein
MRRALWIALLWALLFGLVALDYLKAKSPNDRIVEPPFWALGQQPSRSDGHCSSAPR